MLKPLITIEDWSGGASFNPSKGKKNGYFVGSGVDHNTRPGYLTVLPTSKNYGGNGGSNNVDDFIYSGIRTNYNDENYFGGSTGKIYRQDADPSVTLDHTSSNSSNIVSLAEYKNFMYYAQDTTIGRGDLATGSNPIDYADNWQTGLTSSTWKPMIVSSDENLYIGHGRYVAQWTNTTFTVQALDLKDDVIIQDIDDFGIEYIAIAGNSQNTTKNSKIYLWDRLATTWNDEIPIPEKNIYAMLTVNGVLWILAGTRSISLYVIQLGSRTPVKIHQFSSEYIADQAAVAYPNAIAYRDGRVFFAISGVYRSTSLTNPSGIFSVNADLNNLDFQGHYLKLSNIPSIQYFYYFIGDLSFSTTATSLTWSEYLQGTGSYKKLYREENRLDTDSITATGTYYTFWYQAPPGTLFQFDGFGFDCYPLEQSSVELEYATDFSLSFTDITPNYNTANGTGTYKTKAVPANSGGVTSIMFRVTLTSKSDAGDGLENNFLKRIYATGKLIPNTK